MSIKGRLTKLEQQLGSGHQRQQILVVSHTAVGSECHPNSQSFGICPQRW